MVKIVLVVTCSLFLFAVDIFWNGSNQSWYHDSDSSVYKFYFRFNIDHLVFGIEDNK